MTRSMTMLRFARTVVVPAMVVVAVLLCVDVLHFAHGSLEEFSTAGDTSAVRRVTGVVAVVLVLVEVGLLSLLRYLGRRASLRRRIAHGPQ